MQRINQDRQIGFPRVARPDEYSQRTQIDLGLDDRPEIGYFEFKYVSCLVRSSISSSSVPAPRPGRCGVDFRNLLLGSRPYATTSTATAVQTKKQIIVSTCKFGQVESNVYF